MRLTTKYPLIIVTIALLAVLVTGVVAYQISKTELRRGAERQAIEMLGSRKTALDRYLRSIEKDLSLLAANETTHRALAGFAQAWLRLPSDRTDRLQKLYIHDNPHPTGEKQALDRAGDGSVYSAIHNHFHPWFRRFVDERGYYDLFLFDPEGNLVYTVFKEPDFATNVTNGPWRETDLGRAFRTTAFNAHRDFQIFFDFKPYEPSLGAPASFISTPVIDDQDRYIGVLALQMPIGRINEIMQVSAGMGKTGQAYLVGQDLLVRNDSRFSKASEILKTAKPAGIVNKALEGISGTRQVADASGRQKLVTYTSITFAGQAWAIITEFDLEEILAPVDEMRRALVLAGTVIGVIVVAVGIWFSAHLSRPIVAMTGIMHRLAERDLAVEIPHSQRSDEIGDMEQALVVFKENAVGRKRAEEEAARSHDILQALADNIPEFVSLKDPELRFLFVNRRFEEWVGMNRDAVVGKTVGDIYDPDQAREFDELDKKAMQSEAVSRREVDLAYPDGNTRSVISTRFPVVSAKGETLGLGTVNVDVTALREVQAELKKSMEELTVEIAARKHAEEELRVANSELQELNELKNKFLGMAAHDLRNPLGVIRGMSHMILASEMEEKTKGLS